MYTIFQTLKQYARNVTTSYAMLQDFGTFVLLSCFINDQNLISKILLDCLEATKFMI